MEEVGWKSDFDEFRESRERDEKSAEGDGSQHADVLRELEAAEEDEIRKETLTREVSDFFEDATRAAASIVSKVAEDEERSVSSRVTQDMDDFLRDVVDRASSFVQFLQVAEDSFSGQQNMEPHLHNIVGRTLDSFRYEGTACLIDKHIGKDPFCQVSDHLFLGEAQTPGMVSDDESLIGVGVADEFAASSPEPSDHEQPGDLSCGIPPIENDLQTGISVGPAESGVPVGVDGGEGGCWEQEVLEAIGPDPARREAAVASLVHNGFLTLAQARELLSKPQA